MLTLIQIINSLESHIERMALFAWCEAVSELKLDIKDLSDYLEEMSGVEISEDQIETINKVCLNKQYTSAFTIQNLINDIEQEF